VRRVFVDSSFYIATLNTGDDLHGVAIATARNLIAAGDARFVTSDAIIMEVLAYSAPRGATQRSAAVRLVERIRRARDTEIVEQSRDLLDAAIALYDRRADKTYSLTDCMSMVICRRQGIGEVLTHDHDFVQEGFAILL